MKVKLSEGRQFIANVWFLTKSYWQSEARKKAFLLLSTIIILTFAYVYILVLLNKWNNAFYTALQNYETATIFNELLHFSWLAALYIIVAVYSFFLQQMLALNWRKWLTQKYLDEWLSKKTYYRLQMFGSYTDNPDQRISEDVKLFVEMTLQFTVGILKAFCTLVSFVVILWQLSGPLVFNVFTKNIVIPGYLVWIALIYAIIGTTLTHKIGKKLIGLNFVQQKYEANFRFSMMRLRENAESVAFYDGEKHENSVFKKRFSLLLDNFWQIILKQKQLVWLNSGYSQIAIIFPFVVSMPRYLSKQISLGGLMQIATAFGRVQDSLSYFLDMYSSLAQWKSTVDRLVGFGLHMNNVDINAQSELIIKRDLAANKLFVEKVVIDLPNGSVLLQDLNFELPLGRNLLIKGKSGSGKSSLLRTLAGIWPYASGVMVLPPASDMMFVPQKPYLPLGTLKETLLYPSKLNKSDEEIKALLEMCSIGYLANQMKIEADWSHILSVGEQQRLAFVRILIYEPKWLFLDEATSALDEETEEKMYALLAQRLLETTIVSIGHRSTLAKFHIDEIFINREAGTAILHRNF
ncbi:MAG TPA: ABC transporter ATP-binding protein/permease [Candidatus Avacidaminococcus intestinavium]|uniref:ABC transporter ATP-binding protein/permease n=1 Tax=Candidatus Avacidaminococcus intestinavium TaxID=2840684 RepID=A0A9D1MNN0_9FIRM|nr:ABC transporter ATP-binding protein/permease [Candidatus Avacidaminococcus intestinavium]